MTELTEQQKHLQDIIRQQTNISQEVQQLSNTLDNKRSLFTKLQGAREYLEQIGVNLPEVDVEGEETTEETTEEASVE